MPFAAFFVAFLLLLCIPRRSRKLAVCLLLGALAGLCAVYTTNARLERARANYAGRTVLLTAEVERADSSYFSDTVDATLWVESVNNSPAGFRITCAELPACAAGQRVKGWFTLSAPDEAEQTAQYADGIALQAEPLAERPQLTVLGESGSFRARTHRLQQKLSESLRREMHRDTGGVLAAMTVGDRSGLSAQLRSAYRGAGLSHVLVVSGMHVSILCGDILSVLLPYRWEQSYRSRRRRTVWKSLLALVLMGVTGFTPSVRRAAVAVWVSALGVWVWGPADTLTSLAAAGILMTAVTAMRCGISALSFPLRQWRARWRATPASAGCGMPTTDAFGSKPGRICKSRSGARGLIGCRSVCRVLQRAPALPPAPRRLPSRCWCCGA